MRQWSEVRDELSTMDASLVLVAGGLATLAALPLAESWRTIMRNLGSDLPRRAAYRVFFIGQLAKYLPGSVWSVVGHAEVASAHGIGRGRTATASVLNLGVVAATGAALGVRPSSSAPTWARQHGWSWEWCH